MAKDFKETAAAMLARTEEPKQEPKQEPKAAPKKKAAASDPATMFDNLTAEQQAELIKHIKGSSQLDNSGKEKRTQRLTLVLRPSLLKRAREAANAARYNSLTDFIEEALEEKLERI